MENTKKMKKSPVIITGMHRSGTTMVTKCLERVGLFAGEKKESNNESLLFLKLNKWMLRHTNSYWDNPGNFQFVTDELVSEFHRVIKFHLNSFRSKRSYLGLRYALKYKTIEDIDFPWGWKDPRNTFTIDIWKKIFPDSKIINVIRHPMDVAISLRKRELRLLKLTSAGEVNGIINRLKEKFLKGTITYQQSCRVTHINEGIELWKEYYIKSREMSNKYLNNYYEVRYESFLSDPYTGLSGLVQYLDLVVDDETIVKAIGDIDKSRKYAYIHDQKSKEHYRNFKDDKLIKLAGY